MGTSEPPKPFYIFIDEGGNTDFTPKGTKYFTLTALSKFRPFAAAKQLYELKHDLMEEGMCLERFHACEDKQAVRDKVFSVISQHLDGCEFDSVIVEKSKTHPSLRVPEKFYPKVLGYLIRYILTRQEKNSISRVIVITDDLPVKRNLQAVEKAAKLVLADLVKNQSITSYELLHHKSCSSFDLQIVDYGNWAVFRQWEKGDLRAMKSVQKAFRSQFDIFASGTAHHYTR